MPNYKWLEQVADGNQEAEPSRGPTYTRRCPFEHSREVQNYSLNCATVYQMFEERVRKSPSADYLGHRPVLENGSAGQYQYLTFSEANERVEKLSSALEACGATQGSKVGVYGANSPEWKLSLLACSRTAQVLVPIYDTFGEEAVVYILQHSQVSIILLVSSKLPNFLAVLPKVCDNIKTVVYWGKPASEDLTQKISELGVQCFSFEDFLASSKTMVPRYDMKASDLVTVMYTSGTTANPKGVPLTNSNVLSFSSNLIKVLIEAKYDPESLIGYCYFSFLPMAHIFDYALEVTLMYLGLKIAYFRGNPKLLVEDIGASKPHIMACVPRVLDRIYKQFNDKMNNMAAVGKLVIGSYYRWALNRKLHFMKEGVPQEKASRLYDIVFTKKVKKLLGGNLIFMISGAAPLHPQVEEWARASLGCHVLQGYGLTESTAMGTVASPGVMDHNGTIGPASYGADLCLEAVPEMNYSPFDDPPRGEILFKGDSIFHGYYQNEELTREVIDSEGWFHTGDIGEILPCGAVRIIDRKKNIFKLAQGEYIAAEKLEGIYSQNSLVNQIWIYGNSFESQIVSVVVPSWKDLEKLASANNIKGSEQDLVGNEKLKGLVLKELLKTGAQSNIKGFERLAAVILESEEFSPDNDLLTPSSKIKRPNLLKKYKPQIESLYQRLQQK